MSVEELVKELRQVAAFPRPIHKTPSLMEQAADKLEELAAALRIAQGNTDAAIEDYNEAKAALAEKNKALKLAEFMLTKDSLCKSERLEEGLTVIRRARNAGGKDAE